MSLDSSRSDLLALLQDTGCVTRFKPEAVPADVLEKILQTACRTSSPWNLQTSQFVAASSPAARGLILQHCVEPGPAEQAPILLVALADPSAWKRAPERLAEMVRSGALRKGQEAILLEPIRRLWSTGGAAKTLAVARTYAALQQLSLAAAIFELGTCWIQEYDPVPLAQALHIPDKLLIVGVLGLGYCEHRRTLPVPVLSRMVFADAYGLPWVGASAAQEKPEGL